MLLIIAAKIDKDAQRSKWFTSLEQAGVVVQVWPLSVAQLPAWIEQRMRAKGMQPVRKRWPCWRSGWKAICWPAAQEIEKLSLLHGTGAVDGAAVTAAVSDSARYSVYDLVDRALAGETVAVTRILRGLQGEGEEPVVVLWALSREIRSLTIMAEELRRGVALEQLFAKHRVWENRKRLVGGALKRCPPQTLRRLLRQAAQADRVIKGITAGNLWDELLQLALGVAGSSVVQAAATMS